MSPATSNGQPLDPLAVSLLVTEILGFSPQLLLDDLTNIPHHNVSNTVEAVEAWLGEWIEKQDPAKQDELHMELEGGIASLQTLLDSHSDLAFDLFETWAWRNIFDIPTDIPIVTPHHQGFDLTITEEEERDLREQLEKSKQKLDAVRNKRVYFEQNSL